VALPYTSMSPPDCCLSRAISAATSPLIAVAFHGSGPVSLADATSLGISFIRSRYALPWMFPHALWSSSYVTRPIRK
jgi:hypothetical protein